MKNVTNKNDFHAAPFRLISASLKQLSRDITNDIVKKTYLTSCNFSQTQNFKIFP